MSVADGMNATFDDAVGRCSHGTVVVTVEFVEEGLVVSNKPHHPPEIGLFLIASVEFHLTVATKDKHGHG